MLMSDRRALSLVVDDLSEAASDDQRDWVFFDGKDALRRAMIPSEFSAMSSSLAMANKLARFTVRTLAAI